MKKPLRKANEKNRKDSRYIGKVSIAVTDFSMKLMLLAIS